MTLIKSQFAMNPLQYGATRDGWIDRTQGPTLEEKLEFIASRGFHAIHTDVPHDDPKTYLAAVSAAGLAAGPGYIGMQWSEDRAKQLETLEAARQTAADSALTGNSSIFIAMSMVQGAPRVLRPGVGTDGSDEQLARVRDFMGEACELVKAEGLHAALHPHAGTWIETEAEVRFVLDTLPEDLMGFGPDSGHLAWAGIDPAALIADYRSRVLGLHIKDYDSALMERSRTEPIDYRTAVGMGVWAEPGWGDGNVDAVLSAVGDDFDGWVVIEVDRGRTDTPEESIDRCATWLDSLALD
ncbi:MAG: Xylose isomerase domain protein barrel [Microbacteriaceae bacterium]|nr:Xylose isomerase domain protein barrel [Microbacteriaceae bacterium]